MSNHNRPPLSLPRAVPPPPSNPPSNPPGTPSQLPAAFADLLEQFPLPWVVGPYGDIWVAADVEQYDPEKESNREKIAGPNGSWWRSVSAKPRLVMESPSHQGAAAFMVFAANRLAKR